MDTWHRLIRPRAHVRLKPIYPSGTLGEGGPPPFQQLQSHHQRSPSARSRSPEHSQKQPNLHRSGDTGRPANRGTCRPRLTGPTGKALGISSETKNTARIENARGAATRAGTNRHRVRDRSVDKPAKEEKDKENRLDHLQRQLNQLMGQQYGLEQVRAVDPPITSVIMASPYPTRFKMPSMASYDGSTDADEHLENYQTYVLIQNANEATLCKAFCLTLKGAARQWYWRLMPGSISSFKQLSDVFAAAFLGSKTRNMETSYLYGIKQRESEPLKEYLDRFDKVVMQIKSCSDDTLIQVFWEGIKDRQLVWTLTYDVPPTFAHLRGIARKHAKADEYIRG
ncbi:hypothetical protein TIFTF001_020123 [Ficus carica]|uniref:Retrotransposon gag domain-containing protein n=1 Tax=Ficus carica TaxID=3494 RepID=A0AA88D9J2_FICCA|nr:hypothetical protein TIFTF001_020123 [Ficus carica]